MTQHHPTGNLIGALASAAKLSALADRMETVK
jgi:hypothetical protein